jgi:hypothetical protein
MNVQFLTYFTFIDIIHHTQATRLNSKDIDTLAVFLISISLSELRSFVIFLVRACSYSELFCVQVVKFCHLINTSPIFVGILFVLTSYLTSRYII